MNIEQAKGAAERVGVVPNPKARLRDQFHEAAKFERTFQQPRASVILVFQPFFVTIRVKELIE